MNRKPFPENMINMGDWALCEKKISDIHQFIRISAIDFYIDERQKAWLENGTFEAIELFPFLRYFGEDKLEKMRQGHEEWIYELYAFKIKYQDLSSEIDTALSRFDEINYAFDSYEELISFIGKNFGACEKDFDKVWKTNWDLAGG